MDNTSYHDTSPSQPDCRPLARLTKPELERRIGVLERQAVRYPELAEAVLLERDRLASVLAEKRASKKPARPVEVAA